MAATVGAGALVAMSAVFGASPAAAAPAAQNRPPMQYVAQDGTLVGTCGGTVTGTPGQRVGVNLGPLLIPLGVVPDSGSSVLSTVVGGLVSTVCEVTAIAITPLPPEIRQPIEDLGSAVGGALPAAPPLAPGDGTPEPEQGGGGGSAPEGTPQPGGQPETQPGGAAPRPNVPPVMDFSLPRYTAGGFTGARVPLHDYSNLFAASPGMFRSAPSPGVLSGGDLFGYSPQFSPLGEGGTAGPADDVAAAGRAAALPGTGAGGDVVALPILLAVLLLSGVSAALIRSMVLGGVTRTRRNTA